MYRIKAIGYPYMRNDQLEQYIPNFYRLRHSNIDPKFIDLDPQPINVKKSQERLCLNVMYVGPSTTSTEASVEDLPGGEPAMPGLGDEPDVARFRELVNSPDNFSLLDGLDDWHELDEIPSRHTFADLEDLEDLEEATADNIDILPSESPSTVPVEPSKLQLLYETLDVSPFLDAFRRWVLHLTSGQHFEYINSPGGYGILELDLNRVQIYFGGQAAFIPKNSVVRCCPVED